VQREREKGPLTLMMSARRSCAAHWSSLPLLAAACASAHSSSTAGSTAANEV
jgi:hypothetical protein